MTINGRRELHDFAHNILGAYLVSVNDKTQAEAAKSFLESERCDELVTHFLQTLVKVLAAEIVQERRGDPFRRLLCHPLTDLLEKGDISRKLLGNYFSFLHLVLGDEQEQLTADCQNMLTDLKADPHFTWDMFYDEPSVKHMQWRVLMRILDTFKRFEPRRDWFIELMANRSHAVSLGAHAFIEKPRDEEEDHAPFGHMEFNLMFNALFRPLLTLPAKEDADFTRQFGAPAAVLVRPLVEKLV
jgi:hypothetical protein